MWCWCSHQKVFRFLLSRHVYIHLWSVGRVLHCSQYVCLKCYITYYKANIQTEGKLFASCFNGSLRKVNLIFTKNVLGVIFSAACFKNQTITYKTNKRPYSYFEVKPNHVYILYYCIYRNIKVLHYRSLNKCKQIYDNYHVNSFVQKVRCP